jgi:hypothetical protein
MKNVIGAALLCVAAQAVAQPLHDSIPADFQGTFAPTLAACKSKEGVDLVQVAADGVHYYEGDDYLLIGIAFHGASTKSGKFVPLFNGRFTGRMEVQLLGETNVRMEMETPDKLVRYRLGADGDADPKEPVDQLIRCPK